MQQRISVINRSTGRYSTESINGRDHIVTSMLAIEGDSVMNSLFYPADVVTSSASQLDMLPAPAGHPSSNGQPVSAFNPLAINAHNFGGFTRSPKIEGKKVITELAIDTEIANQSKKGKKILDRIRRGKRIGVSTGLVANVFEESGKIGKDKYTGRIDNIKYDHVAVLLDEMPAGRNTYTLNHEKTIKHKQRGHFMDEVTFDLTPLAQEDRATIANMSLKELVALVNGDISEEEAEKVIVNAGKHVSAAKEADVQEYLANSEDFTAWRAEKAEARNERIAFIVENSKMQAEHLESLEDDALESLAASVAPKNKRVMNGKAGAPELVLLDDNIAQEA